MRGTVKVSMTGDQRCTKVMINPEVLADVDAEMLQDMILSAINLSLDKSRELHQSDWADQLRHPGRGCAK